MKRQVMITKEIAENTPVCGTNAELPMEEQTVTAKFFNPVGNYTWYMTEMDKDQDMAFGFVQSYMCPDGEFGAFSIKELQAIQLPFEMYIERDRHFEPMNLKELYDKVQKGIHV